MEPGILDYFERQVPIVARQQSRLQSAIASHLGLSSGLRGSGERPDPFLFLLVNSQPLPEREARDQYLAASVGITEYRSRPIGGIVEVPHFGQFHVRNRAQFVKIGLADRRNPTCSDSLAELHRYHLVERQIAVPQFIPPAFRPIFYGDRRVHSASVDGIVSLRKAARHTKIIRAFGWIRQVVRLVVLFRGGRLNSLYHPHAHGAVFIRLEQESDTYHVFEELIHQAGHAFFAILLCAASNFVRDQPKTLETAFDVSDSSRNLLVALHGVVTEALIAEALYRVWRLSSDTERRVVFGRLAFCLSKLGADLNQFIEIKGLLRQRGLRLLAIMANSYTSIVGALGSDLSRADLTDQPYIYDPMIFRDKNGWLENFA